MVATTATMARLRIRIADSTSAREEALSEAGAAQTARSVASHLTGAGCIRRSRRGARPAEQKDRTGDSGEAAQRRVLCKGPEKTHVRETRQDQRIDERQQHKSDDHRQR